MSEYEAKNPPKSAKNLPKYEFYPTSAANVEREREHERGERPNV